MDAELLEPLELEPLEPEDDEPLEELGRFELEEPFDAVSDTEDADSSAGEVAILDAEI